MWHTCSLQVGEEVPTEEALVQKQNKATLKHYMRWHQNKYFWVGFW